MKFIVRREQLGDNEQRWAVWDESTKRIRGLFDDESIAAGAAEGLNEAHKKAVLDLTTRELLTARVFVICETSGKITFDKRQEFYRINALRASVGLDLIDRVTVESWPGEFNEA